MEVGEILLTPRPLSILLIGPVLYIDFLSNFPLTIFNQFPVWVYTDFQHQCHIDIGNLCHPISHFAYVINFIITV